LTVVVPAALPELRTTLILAVGLSWAAVVGAEYIGVRDGLGSILIVAELFTNTGQMVVIALVLIVFSLMSFWLVDRLFGRLLAWRDPGRQIGAPATETEGDRANGFSG
jgi:sulfonate transport system permease protein